MELPGSQPPVPGLPEARPSELGGASPGQPDPAWARSPRRRLATQLREAGRAEPREVEALLAELLAVCRAVLRGGGRRAWRRLLEALQLCAPFRGLLSGRAPLPAYLRALRYQACGSRALLADLDLWGALRRAFPRECAALQDVPEGPWPLALAAEARHLPAAPEPAFAGLPCPFRAAWGAPAAALLRPRPVSLPELQRCVGPVGGRLALQEAPWEGGLGMLPLALAAALPVDFAGAACSSLEPAAAVSRAPALDRPAAAAPADRQAPTSGLQVAEALSGRYYAGEIRFFYLNTAPNRHFRPYDLVTVPGYLIKPQHYVFSPFGVLCVHPEEGSEALSLGDWHREARLWQLMQYIPFFRLFLVRKAFTRWYFNVKHLQFLKLREKLSLLLLQAVPHFGAALLHISRLLQELQAVHWLPTGTSRCYNFVELKRSLAQVNSNADGFLHRFLSLCTSILELVRDDTYKMVHGLQMEVQGYKLYITKESPYQQRLQFERLQCRLREAESWLRKLGALAVLVNFLICQTLISVMHEETSIFVNCTMQTDGSTRKAVLRVQLVFSADNQLVVFPSSGELEDCLLGALQTMVETVLETTRVKSEKAEAQAGPRTRTPEAERPTSQTAGDPVAGPASGRDQISSLREQLQQMSVTVLCSDKAQLVHRLDLKACSGLQVVGHRLRAEYPLLSREQLETDLHSDSIIQKAMAKLRDLFMAGLAEVQLLCREYSWLGQIYQYVHSWNDSQLENMKGLPAEEYVNQILKLRTWAVQMQKVPQVVITFNRFFLVDCGGILQDILPLLASIDKDILALLLSETTKRSEQFIAELASVLQLYMNVGTDIFTIAKCSQKLEHYQGQMAELQEYVDYVRALNEVIQQCYRPLSPSEESLENMLLDTWDAFVYQQREVSDFIVSRRLSIIAELSSSLQEATRELQELLTTVTLGRFQDPAQNPRVMEDELIQLLQRFQGLVGRVTDLCHSQRILTGGRTDLSLLIRQQEVIEIHIRVWQLFRIVSEQIKEWKCLAFIKFSAPLALEKTKEWQKEGASLEGSLPSHHRVMQACLSAIGNFQKYLPLLLKLGSHFLKVGCWKEIFAVMGAKCPMNMQFTLGQLLSYPLLEYSDAIFRVYAHEKSRHYARDTLLRLQRAWAEKQFRLVNFILNVPYQEPQPERFRRPTSGRQRAAKLEYISKDSGTFVLSDTTELKAAVEHSIFILQNMILSPFSSDILEEAKSWVSTLRTFESLFYSWVSFQQKWVFLNIVLYEMNITLPSAELDSRFHRLDAHFREVMRLTCNDPLVLSSVQLGPGSSRDSRFIGATLQAAFLEGSAELQGLIRALDYVLEATRMGFPRLFFLSNEELVAMLSTANETADASAWSQRCFPGVCQLDLLLPPTSQNPDVISAELPRVQVVGLLGSHGEKLKLCSAVPLGRKVTQWLCILEHHMKESVFNKLQECVTQRLVLRPQLDLAFERRPGPTELPLHLVAECWAGLGNTFPTQCVLVAEEALWRVAVEEAFLNRRLRKGLELRLSLKLEAVVHYIRNYRSIHTWNPEQDSLGMLLGALVIITLQQRDITSQLLKCKEVSVHHFEWARHLKYSVHLLPEKARAAGLPPSCSWVGSPPGCWAEVLDRRFPYGYEFLGTGSQLLGSPLLDRTFLGLLLALEEFCCGGLLGRPDVGKSHTVRGLAQFLGRHLVTLHCTRQMTIGCLSRHLCGAVHSGALLVLESVERLEPAVLSAFSHRLVDLQRMCLNFQEGGRATTSGQPSAVFPPASPGSESSESSEEGEEQPVGLPELGTDDAEPYQPRVLGNILFGGRLLRVRETYGCVVTLESLPEQLRLALRPLAVLPPDLTRLAEVMLLAAGFREAARLAEKLCAFLEFERMLNPGPHFSSPTLIRKVTGMAIDILFAPTPRQDTLLSRAKPSPRTAFFLGLEEEPAVVKALCHSSLLTGPEGPRLHNVRELLHEVFPSAPLPPSEQLPPRLQSALVAQLQEDKLQPDPDLLLAAGQLSQAMQGATGILLLGPSGSGKTTTWRTLSKAQSRLAASDATPGMQGSSAPEKAAFQPVSTVCLWPNALSVSEFLGNLEGSLWQDGVFSRILQRAATSTAACGNGEGSSQQWLVLDGTACQEWLEPISLLFSPRPFFSLPNGQRLRAPKNLRFLFEMLDASEMPPSVCTHCTLLHLEGSRLWQVLLSSAFAPVHHKYSLSLETLTTLHSLAKELFPATMAFLQQHCCPALLPHAHPQHPLAHGVQETTAFARIFQALLKHYMRRDQLKPRPAVKMATETSSWTPPSLKAHSLDEVPTHHPLLAQSIFVFAYVWGFGSHLQTRYWPLFDHFVRRALRNSSSPIHLPAAVSAFDLYPLAEDGTLRPFNGRYLHSYLKALPVGFSVLPQHERVLFVLNMLLGSDQPILLVGEPGCGKSTFAEMLVQPNYLYHRVCLTPAFSTVHLRQLLHRRSQSTLREKGLFPTGKPTRGAASKGRFLFLMEDLHLAFVDPVRGTSPVIESLRQTLTLQQFYHAETLELQQCPAAGFNCFGTLSIPIAGSLPLCPRFGRLFSTVVLPAMSRESLLTMHTGTVLTWLEKFPLLTRHHELASTVVKATLDTYEAVRRRFRPSPACCLFQFSLHDVAKVIKGMLLLRPRPGVHLGTHLEDHGSKGASPRRTSAMARPAMGAGHTAVLSTRLIIRLWMHESLRTFCDPLRGKQQRELCEQILLEIATNLFCAKHCVLRVVPSLTSPVQTRTATQFPSTSDTCLATASAWEEDPREEHLLLSLQAEPEFPYSGEVGYPNSWDPVEQAPALALDPPDPSPWEEVALGEPEDETPETEPEEVDAGKRPSSVKPSQLRVPEAHATPHRSFLMRVKRRTSGRKDSSGPLLPLQLLLLQGESPADIVFSKDLAPDLYGPNAHNPYQEKLWKTLEAQLRSCLPPDFLLCSDMLRHVVRLARLLWGPDRHGALVSFVRCTGRQSLVALVARVTDTLLMTLPASASEAEALVLLKSASWQAGITGRRVMLLVHSGVSVPILHQVLALMTEGTCPGLSNQDDSAAIVQAMMQENQTIKRNMREDLVLQKFFQLVHSNLHVFLLLGAPGSLALPPLTATALAQSLCSLEIYEHWSHESLLQVASKRLKGHFKSAMRFNREPLSLHAQKNLLHNTAVAASQIHSSAANYASSLANSLPLVSPKNFLDFLDSYVCLLDSLQEQVTRRAERVKVALKKMGEVSKKQQEHTRDVRVLQQKLGKIKQQMAQSQKEVEREQEVLKQQEIECRKFEARIDVLTKKRDALEKKKEIAMKKVSQDYKAALAALRVQDIEELRSYRQPPALVVQVTDPLCLMFQVEPGWDSAKLLLNREDFYQDLVFYPKETLNTQLFQALGQVVSHNGLSVAAIQNASQAAAALYQWICSVYWYHWALCEWQPAMLQLQSCEDQINAEKVSLGDRRLHSEYLRDTTQARIRELRQKQEHQEKLLQQLTQSLQAKEEASTVESSVAEHLASWTAMVKDLEIQQTTVYGDALLCSAVVSYLGPFSPPRRKELLEKWQAACEGSQVLLSPCDVSWLLQKELPCPGQASSGPPLLPLQKPLKMAALLSSAQQQRLWDRLHKPKDAESRLTAMIVHSSVRLRAHRWPLLVDPDKQAQTWLLMTSSLEEEESQAQALSDLVPDMVEQAGSEEFPEDNLEILSLTSSDLEQSLKDAIKFGNPVLLMDFEKDVPWCSALQQLMEKESFWGCPEGKIFFPASEEDGVEAETLPIPPSFFLYLCTELPLKSLAAEADHSLLKRLNVIDLSLSQGALEDRLLGEVLHVERPEILKNQQILYLGILQLEGKLDATEEELMDLISQPQRSLLEEENFMPIVRLLQTQIQALHATHRHMVSQHQDQALLCGRYRPVAGLAVGLHEALQQVGRLHPLYRFPAEFCISRVRQALISAKRQEASKQESLEARLMELSRMVLWHLLTQALPCLREGHRPLYFFLGAMATLRVVGDVSPLEWLAFTQGLRDPAAKALLQPPAPGPVCPSWVSAEAWEECTLLENLPGFHGLLASLAEKAVQWQEYFSLPSTVVGPALCPSHTHLSPFQRAILWRILCPRAMCQVISDLTTCLLGWSFTEKMAAASPYSYSRANKPTILVTVPAGSQVSFTHPLLWIQQMAAQRGRKGRVVVISFGTPDASQRVQRTLPFCTKKGKWLVLDNCQLLRRWDPEVLQQLDLILTTPAGLSKGGPMQMHPKFRLWLITTLDAPDSVPGPVHRSANTFFCEMPLELKGILAHTHQWLQGQVQNLDTEKRLSLLVLHGALLYRQNYAPWTQAASYLWSHGEVLAGLKALENLSWMDDPSEEAQLQLAGTILYGGHVLDEGDAQAVESLCQQCLAPASHLLPGSGLQKLLAAVIGHSSPGLFEDEASAATQGRMQQLPSPMDPAWVGLCSSLQPQMLAGRSHALLSALKMSQGLWPHWTCQLRTALEPLAKRGLEVVRALQEQLEQCGWEVGARGRPPHGQPRPKPRPLQRFLLEEAGAFLALLEQVGRDLTCALRGLPCSSPRCMAILQALQRQQLPRHWLHYTPTGSEPLQDWLGTLQQRGKLLCRYLRSIAGEPVVCYQLAAFQQPQRLFLALLQETARVEKQELGSLRLDQQVLPSLLSPGIAPEKGLYLDGLEVYHAAWNAHSGHLQESLSAQACQLPLVWVQASREPCMADSVPSEYQCPVYLGTPQATLDLRSQRVVMHLPLSSKMSPELCTQLRVHAISILR